MIIHSDIKVKTVNTIFFFLIVPNGLSAFSNSTEHSANVFTEQSPVTPGCLTWERNADLDPFTVGLQQGQLLLHALLCISRHQIQISFHVAICILKYRYWYTCM